MKKGSINPHLWRARISNCIVCGKEFRAVNDFKNRKQKYCSKDCWSNRGHKQRKAVCVYCKKEFEYRYGERRYCSRKCAFEHKVGENASQWKGGATLKNDRARNGNKLKQWRDEVFKIDNYECAECGSKDEIQAHHIKEFSKHKELRYNLNNGKTLCIKCHGKIHNRDFSNRRRKKCENCNKEIVNKTSSNLCRSCAIKKSWKKRKMKNT